MQNRIRFGFVGDLGRLVLLNPFLQRPRTTPLSVYFIGPTMPVTAASPFILPNADSDQLLFGPLDLDDGQQFSQLNREPSFADIEPDFKTNPYSFSALPTYEFGLPSTNVFFDTGGVYSPPESAPMEDLSTWINDSELSFSPTDSAFSPTFAALHPLPRSVSPASSSFDVTRTMKPRVRSIISPCEMALQSPSWATQLWDSNPLTDSPTTCPSALPSPSSLTRPSIGLSPLATDATVRQQRIPIRRSSVSLSSLHLFHSSSAPTTHAESSSTAASPLMTRSYVNGRTDSVEDRDATVRSSSRRKRTPECDSNNSSSAGTSAFGGINSKKDITRILSSLVLSPLG